MTQGRTGHVALALLVTLALAIGPAACGGGRSKTSTTAGSSGSVPPIASTSPSTRTSAPRESRAPRRKRAAKPPPPLPASTRPAAVVATSRSGGAPAFRRRGGDNSVPDFGAEASAAERNRAAAALASYLRAYARGEWGRACGYLSAKRRRSLAQLPVPIKGPRGCAAELKAFSTVASTRNDPLTGGLVAFRVRGDRAFALFYGPDHKKYDMPMRRERGAWKVSEAMPFLYPY